MIRSRAITTRPAAGRDHGGPRGERQVQAAMDADGDVPVGEQVLAHVPVEGGAPAPGDGSDKAAGVPERLDVEALEQPLELSVLRLLERIALSSARSAAPSRRICSRRNWRGDDQDGGLLAGRR